MDFNADCDIVGCGCESVNEYGLCGKHLIALAMSELGKRKSERKTIACRQNARKPRKRTVSIKRASLQSNEQIAENKV